MKFYDLINFRNTGPNDEQSGPNDEQSGPNDKQSGPNDKQSGGAINDNGQSGGIRNHNTFPAYMDTVETPQEDVISAIDKPQEVDAIQKQAAEALQNATQKPQSKEKIKEGLSQLTNEERNNINNSIAKFNITIDDVAIIALLTAFLAVINGPGGAAITFGAFLTIVAGLDIEKRPNLEAHIRLAKELQKPIPGTDPQDVCAAQLTPPLTPQQAAVG